ncbi:MAG: phosphoribosyltransferase family protein [Pseudomonadota bacterium]
MFEIGEREGACVESPEGRAPAGQQGQSVGVQPAKSPTVARLDEMDLQGIGALLAVVFAVYAILAQARRSTLLLPFIIVSLLTSSLVFSGYCFVLTIFKIASSGYDELKDIPYVVFSGEFAFFAFSGILFLKLLQDYSIQKYHRVDKRTSVKKFLRFGDIQYVWKKINNKPDREGNRVDFSEDFLLRLFRRYFYVEKNDPFEFLHHAKQNHQALSISSIKGPNSIHNRELAQLALHFLDNHRETFVQYVSCTRHPVEFLQELISAHAERHELETTSDAASRATDDPLALKESKADDQLSVWTRKDCPAESLRERLVLVDAHTPHFGFDEPIYHQKARYAKKWVLDVITSGNGYPGIHTALARGFKKLSARSKTQRFGLIIFEDLSALADIDSVAQFRLFSRHVVASERLMNGILTIFYEEKSAIQAHPFLPEAVDRHFEFHGKYDVAYTPWEIADAVETVAGKIHRWIEDKVPAGQKLLVVTLLKGGAHFSSDLLDQLERLYGDKFRDRVEHEEISIASYGKGIRSGKPQVQKTGVFSRARGRTVLVVDDICHSGRTLEYVLDQFDRRHVEEIKSVVAIQRKNPKGTTASYRLFDFEDAYGRYPNAWMYGYGMDDEKVASSRRLPCFVFKSREGPDHEDEGC